MEVLDADPAIDMVFGHVTEFVSPDVDEDALALLRPLNLGEPARRPTSC